MSPFLHTNSETLGNPRRGESGARARVLGAALLGLSVWAANACALRTNEVLRAPAGEDDGGGGANASSSGGRANGGTACPSSPPALGTACTAAELWCQYGD